MAATSHPLSTLAAIDTLRAGGNAVDAAIAAVAVQSVVEPQMTGIGGDCFAILALGGKPPIALNGSGWSPAGLTPEHLRGQKFIAENSPHAVTVPGAVDAWCHLVKTHGRLDMAQILAPAIALAEEGFRVTPRAALDWRVTAAKLAGNAIAAKQFLPGGKTPDSGDKFSNPALGRTLRSIAKDGRKAFYEGAVAGEIVAFLRDLGGCHSEADFAEFSCFETAPISAKFAGHDVLECPPNGQGLAALIIMRILDGFNLAAMNEVDTIHLLAEASKAGYRQRDLLIAEPAHMKVSVHDVLSEGFIGRLRAKIDMTRASEPAEWSEAVHRDTVCLSVVDKDRNVVSLINSIFSHFGSGLYAPESGVLLQNRGCGFSLREGHPNIVAGRKRPLHTIIPGLVMKDGRPVMPFGVMGGHYQATGHAHLLTEMLVRNKDPQLANEGPRSFCFGKTLTLEPTIGSANAAALAGRGHTIAWAEEPLGGCQAIWIDQERGVLIGGSDHRKDGMALGY